MALSDTITSLGTAIINLVDNKVVTTISAESTDSKVPSARCVYNALQNSGDGGSQTVQDIQTLSNGTITLNKSKSIYLITLDSSITFTFNLANNTITSSQAFTFELYVYMPDVVSLTFPSTVSWLEEPDLSKSGIYLFVFRTTDNGNSWTGNIQGVTTFTLLQEFSSMWSGTYYAYSTDYSIAKYIQISGTRSDTSVSITDVNNTYIITKTGLGIYKLPSDWYRIRFADDYTSTVSGVYKLWA